MQPDMQRNSSKLMAVASKHGSSPASTRGLAFAGPGPIKMRCGTCTATPRTRKSLLPTDACWFFSYRSTSQTTRSC